MEMPGSVTGRQSLAAAVTPKEIEDIAGSFLLRIGFNRMAFHLSWRGSHSDRLVALLCNYPPAWVERYLDQEYLYHDPVHKRGMMSVLPFTWRSLPLDGASKTVRTLFEEAAGHGIADGFSVPLHSPATQGLFSALPHGSFDERTRALEERGAALTDLAHLMHERILALYKAQAVPDRKLVDLTEREKEALMWIASGKTGREIARIMAISEDTANQHVRASMVKLSASTRTHAAVKAVTLGIVQPLI